MAKSQLLSLVLDPKYWAGAGYVLLSIGLAYLFRTLTSRRTVPANAPRLFDALPVIGSARWFTRRQSFMLSGARAASSGQFSFYVGKHLVIGLSGDAGRKTFFESRGLELAKAYSTLFNAFPQMDGGGDSTSASATTPTNKDNNSIEGFYGKQIRLFGKLAKKEWLEGVLPSLLSDIGAAMSSLEARPDGAVLNPFDDFYGLIYQMTMRTLGCADIAENPVELKRTLNFFEMIEGSSSAASIGAAVVFPWMPTMRYVRMMWGGTRFYMVLAKVIEGRIKTGSRRKDAVQILMDQGDKAADIVQFMLAALFAGLINSGINAGWLVTYLAADAGWRNEIRREVEAAVDLHRTSPDQSGADVLGTLGIDDFEAEFPMLELALRETIRLTMVGTGFRHNDSGRDIAIGDTGECVPRDAFAVYLMDDVHYDARIYSDPDRWDPSRYLPERAADRKKGLGSHSYVGWGSGRHPCLGTRFAKLSMYVLIAFFVATFDFEVCDKAGRPLPALPAINRQKYSAHKPEKPVYIRYWALPRK